MRVVDLEAFLDLPAGTVFSFYYPAKQAKQGRNIEVNISSIVTGLYVKADADGTTEYPIRALPLSPTVRPDGKTFKAQHLDVEVAMAHEEKSLFVIYDDKYLGYMITKIKPKRKRKKN